MACKMCEKVDGPMGELPLDHYESFLNRSHESVDLFLCKDCGAAYLGVTVDANDDTLGYWAKVSAPELLELRKIESEQQLLREAVEIVQSKARYIYWGPGEKPCLVSEHATVLYGHAPW